MANPDLHAANPAVDVLVEIPALIDTSHAISALPSENRPSCRALLSPIGCTALNLSIAEQLKIMNKEMSALKTRVALLEKARQNPHQAVEPPSTYEVCDNEIVGAAWTIISRGPITMACQCYQIIKIQLGTPILMKG